MGEYAQAGQLGRGSLTEIGSFGAHAVPRIGAPELASSQQPPRSACGRAWVTIEGDHLVTDNPGNHGPVFGGGNGTKDLDTCHVATTALPYHAWSADTHEQVEF